MRPSNNLESKTLSDTYSVGTNEKIDFNELWQQDKLLKTMEMNEAWSDTYDGGYTSIPTWTHPQNSLGAAEALSLKISSHETSLKWSQKRSESAQE